MSVAGRADAVVIAGMPRSGTQLMRRLLGSHPLVAVPTREFKVDDVVRGSVDVAGFLDRLPLDEWEVPAADLRDRPIAEVYPELLRRCAAAVGKPIGGEKSPGNEFCWDHLEEWYAGRRLVVVHLVRDPVERLASLARAPFRARLEVDVDPGRQGRLWCASVRRGLERTERHPDRYRLVRYEDVTARPEEVARELFGLIGVPHDPDAVSLHAYASGDNTSFPEDPAGSDPERPAIRPVPSRAGVLTAEDASAVWAATEALAAPLGYGPAGGVAGARR